MLLQLGFQRKEVVFLQNTVTYFLPLLADTPLEAYLYGVRKIIIISWRYLQFFKFSVKNIYYWEALIRSYNVKVNQIGLVVSETLWYTHTKRHRIYINTSKVQHSVIIKDFIMLSYIQTFCTEYPWQMIT